MFLSEVMKLSRAVVAGVLTFALCPFAHGDTDEVSAKAASTAPATAAEAEAKVPARDKAKDTRKNVIVVDSDRGRPHCRTAAPTGSRIKETRCVTAEQRRARQENGKKFLRRAQGLP